MKKLLLCTTVALTGFALSTMGSAPAKADGIKLDLAGHFKGYVVYNDQHGSNAGNGSDPRAVDFLRETEIHFTGETTLDNGLTVGVHHEADIDNEFTTGADDAFVTEESYAYMSGYWGRVNIGKEDGADYLLQVAAPSADENYDGLRQYINPFNFSDTAQSNIGGVAGAGLPFTAAVLDYAADSTGYANKLTYLTPVFSGFQFGASYTPDVGGDVDAGAQVGSGILHGGFPRVSDGSRAFGTHDSNTVGGVVAPSYGSAYEGSGRWEGQWRDFGITVGGGITWIKAESSNTASGVNAAITGVDDFKEYNGGANVAFGPFNVGGAYLHNSGGLDGNSEGRTYVGGVDYTVGPFKLGGSWLNNHQQEGTGNGSLNTNRWTGGVVYTYGPGMTFRGSASYMNSHSDTPGTGDIDGVVGLLGTQINF